MAHQEESVPQGRVRRVVPLARFAARAAIGHIFAGLRQRAGATGAVEQFHARSAERYTELLGRCKGALMKAGQIMPMLETGTLGTGGFAPYHEALGRLLTETPPMHVSLLHKVLNEEVGSPILHFDQFNDEPLAAASIGQVHRAVLHDGRDVAVKIQYPGVARAIRDDLANAELIVTLMRFALAASGMQFDVRLAAAEATARITEELDYRHEADMMGRFAELYRGHPFIRIPQPILSVSSERVLTMSYLDGMDWAAAKHADQGLRNTWVEVIARFHNGNYRHSNFIHADPHPENYRFYPDGGVGFLDFGCVQVVPEGWRRLFVALMRAAIDNRKDEYRQLMIQIGLIQPDTALSANDLDGYMADLAYQVNLPQPLTFTPEVAAREMRSMFGKKQFALLAHMTMPPQAVFLPRIQLAFNHLAAGLRATVPVRAILEDMDGVAEPITEVGELHHAWVRERGHPGALEHHHHP